MCGIVGVWRLDGKPVDQQELIRARDKMTARGPDDAGLYVDSDVGLGHRRLSIIDLTSNGRMPMANETGTVWAVFNGEIYNFVTLRKELEARSHVFRSQTDGEVIIHAYEEWGTECFTRFDGMFAIAIWDSASRRMVLARDITGEKPLFYRYVPSTSMLFASTLDALLSFDEIEPTLDRESLIQYLGFGFVPFPRSIIANIHKVAPGTHIVFDETNGASATRYWNLEEIAAEPRHKISLEVATDELHDLLRAAVRSRLVADVPLGAFLSGGIDSSLVVALMAELGASTVRTFTIGFSDSAFDESEHAHRVAKHLGVENTMFVLTARDVLGELDTVTTAFDEPMADYSVLPSLAVSRLARRHVTVSLTGDGADEAFGGYRYYSGTKLFERVGVRVPARLRRFAAERARMVPVPRVQRALQRGSASDTAGYFGRCGFYRGATASGSLARILPGGIDRAEDVVADYVRAHKGPITSATEAGMLWDAAHTLPDAWLTKVDRTTMAVSLEARPPFLSRTVLEYAFALPLEYRVTGSERKIILRRILSRYVPRDLFERPKQGFTAPLRKWFASELREELQERLSPRRLERFGVFDTRAVQSLLDEQLSGRTDHTQLLWALFHLDRWHEAHLAPARAR